MKWLAAFDRVGWYVGIAVMGLGWLADLTWLFWPGAVVVLWMVAGILVGAVGGAPGE